MELFFDPESDRHMLVREALLKEPLSLLFEYGGAERLIFWSSLDGEVDFFSDAGIDRVGKD